MKLILGLLGRYRGSPVSTVLISVIPRYSAKDLKNLSGLL